MAFLEPALVYFAISIAMMLVGPGRFSLDAMLFKKRDSVAEERKEWLKLPAA